MRWFLMALLLTAGYARADTNAPASLFPFVLPWDDASPGVANVSAWLEKPSGKRGFIVARDGHSGLDLVQHRGPEEEAVGG